MSHKITALIVDDEQHARQAMINALKLYPEIEVLAECEQGIDAIKFVNELNPHVLFLDIHMPKLDGFDVLELLGQDAPLIVFVTAYDEYAIRAFDSNALDYLLKPINPERLQKTIERVCERFKSGDDLSFEAVLTEMKQKKAPLRRILIRDGADVHVVAVEEVLYVESADDYVAIHVHGKTHIKQERLQNLEKQINNQGFCRIHRSYLLNLNYLSGIESETKDTKVAVLKDGKRLPISRSGYSRLRELL